MKIEVAEIIQGTGSYSVYLTVADRRHRIYFQGGKTQADQIAADLRKVINRSGRKNPSVWRNR